MIKVVRTGINSFKVDDEAYAIPVSDEPQVRQRCDRSGQIYWQVYDPATNRSARLSSEQEVRQWLEQRFYQHRNL